VNWPWDGVWMDASPAYDGTSSAAAMSVLACKFCKGRTPDRQAPVSEGGVLDSSGAAGGSGFPPWSIVGHESDVR
jgi:hypothetical protein